MHSDMAAMLWKEQVNCRKNLQVEIPGMLTTVALFGILPMVAFLRENTLRQGIPAGAVMAAALLLSAQLYCTLISEGVFGEEISGRTLRMLLTTRLNPMAIFLAKWATLMARIVVMVALTTAMQIATCAYHGAILAKQDLRIAACGAGIAVLYGGYCVGVNAVISLAVRSPMQLRQYSTLVSLIPLGMLGISLSIVGFKWIYLLAITSALFALLCLVSMVAALVAFQTEQVRL